MSHPQVTGNADAKQGALIALKGSPCGLGTDIGETFLVCILHIADLHDRRIREDTCQLQWPVRIATKLSASPVWPEHQFVLGTRVRRFRHWTTR